MSTPRAAFTLIELVLVMALLAVLAAIAVPSLTRSIRGHALSQEADRLLALAMYARDEAVSQGIPFILWLDVDGGRLGVDAKPGYGSPGTDNARAREQALSNDVHLDPVGQGMVSTVAPPATAATISGQNGAGGAHGGVAVAEFEPDGTLDPASLARVRLVDRGGDALAMALTSDGAEYEIVREGQ